MRAPERIDKFLSIVDKRHLLLNIWKICNEDSRDNIINFHSILTLIEINKVKIHDYWHENPDLRYSQVLVNLGIIPNYPGFWYYVEESDILRDQGFPISECLVWGVNYDKDMNKLPKTIYKYINELETDHMHAILDGSWTGNPEYLEAFKYELNRRKGG